MLTSSEFLEFCYIYKVQFNNGPSAGVQTLNSLFGDLNLTSNDSSVVITPAGTSIDLSVSGGGGSSQITQQLWANDADGDDTNNGDIDAPLKTYAGIVAKYLTLSPSITNQILANMIGDFNEILTLYPFLHINGNNCGTFTSSSNITNHASFDTTPNAFCNVMNTNLDSTLPIVVTYAAAQNQKINFLNTSFGDIPNITVQGFSGSELVYVQNAFPKGSALASGVSVTKATLALDNATVIGSSNVSCDSGIDSTLSIKNSVMGGKIFVDSTSSTGGVPSLQLYTTINSGYQLSGTASLISIDPFSYTSVPTYFGGSTISQVTNSSLTDSILQTSYTPINFTPIASSKYAADTLSAMIAGIDAQLAVSGGGSLQDAYDAGTPGSLGSILLDSSNADPFTTSNSYHTGEQENFVSLNFVDPNSFTPTAWGYSFKGVNSASSVIQYAKIRANQISSTASSETSSLDFVLKNSGSDVVPFILSGNNINTPFLSASQIVSTDGSKNLVSLPLPAGGVYTPTLTAASNIGSLSLVKAFYSCPLNQAGKTVMVTMQFTGVPSAASNVITQVSCPVTANFGTAIQAAYTGGNLLHNPGVDDGNIYNVISVNGSSDVYVQAEIPSGGIGQTYTFNVSFMYQIQ